MNSQRSWQHYLAAHLALHNSKLDVVPMMRDKADTSPLPNLKTISFWEALAKESLIFSNAVSLMFKQPYRLISCTACKWFADIYEGKTSMHTKCKINKDKNRACLKPLCLIQVLIIHTQSLSLASNKKLHNSLCFLFSILEKYAVVTTCITQATSMFQPAVCAQAPINWTSCSH